MWSHRLLPAACPSWPWQLSLGIKFEGRTCPCPLGCFGLPLPLLLLPPHYLIRAPTAAQLSLSVSCHTAASFLNTASVKTPTAPLPRGPDSLAWHSRPSTLGPRSPSPDHQSPSQIKLSPANLGDRSTKASLGHSHLCLPIFHAWLTSSPSPRMGPACLAPLPLRNRVPQGLVTPLAGSGQTQAFYVYNSLPIKL